MTQRKQTTVRFGRKFVRRTFGGGDSGPVSGSGRGSGRDSADVKFSVAEIACIGHLSTFAFAETLPQNNLTFYR